MVQLIIPNQLKAIDKDGKPAIDVVYGKNNVGKEITSGGTA